MIPGIGLGAGTVIHLSVAEANPPQPAKVERVTVG
jgi:predicted polyphosphate/ATP-dependent NAD kinase